MADPLAEQHSKAIWDAFGRALHAEPRESKTVEGASGIDHSVEAIAVDDKNGRVIIVAAEPNPRIAALMQVDIQATMPDTRVLVARPVAFDIAAFARGVLQQLGEAKLDLAQLNKLSETARLKTQGAELTIEDAGEFFRPILPTLQAFKNVRLPALNQILAVIQQAALIDWQGVLEQGKQNPPGLVIPLTNLLILDGMEADRQYGVCGIPLYELTDRDWEVLLGGTAIEDIEERLKALGIYQYFFPPPDQIALGVADRSRATRDTLSSSVELAPQLGHPLGPAELIEGGPIMNVVEQLQDRGLLVEGELGMEVTPAGSSARATVKFRPREGLVSKLLQRFAVNLSVSWKDFLPPQ